MSDVNWAGVFGGLLDRGLDIYEAKELGTVGITGATAGPNDGTSGTAASLPDQGSVNQAQTVGPVSAPGDTGQITVAGITMDKGTLQFTAFVLLVLWLLGYIRP